MEGYNLKCTSSFESKEKASLRMAEGHKQDPVFPVKFIMSQKNLTCLHYLPQTVKIKHHKTFAVIIWINDNIKGYYRSILVSKRKDW